MGPKKKAQDDDDST